MMQFKLKSSKSNLHSSDLLKLITKSSQVIVISACFLIFSCALILNPLSTIYENSIEKTSNDLVYGKESTQNVLNQLLVYVWFSKDYDIALSEQAKLHMADVRDIFASGQILLLILMGLTYLILRKKSSILKKKILFQSVIASFVVFLLLIVAVSTNFETTFIVFHELLFKNALWMFPATDSLILYFPQSFFYMISVQIIIWQIVFHSTVLIFLLLLRVKEHQQRLSSSKPSQHI